MRICNLQTLTEFLNFKPEERKKIDEIALEIGLSLLTEDYFKNLCDNLSQCEALKMLTFGADSFNKQSANFTHRLNALMQSLVCCKQLNEIILAANNIGTWNKLQLQTLGQGLLRLLSLKTLSLAYNGFDKLQSSSFKLFFRTLALSSVENLDLEGNSLGKLTLPCLSQFGWALITFKHLRIISLARNRLTTEEDSYFQILRASKTLYEIEGIQELTTSHLQELYEVMDNNKQNIINSEVQHLPPQVKTLIFSYCYSDLPEAPYLHSAPEFPDNPNVKRYKSGIT